MTTDTNQDIKIINCLKELDCCSRCILMFIGVQDDNLFLQPDAYLNTLYEDVKPNITSSMQQKRVKSNPCRICLGILQDATIERLAECISTGNIDDYKYSDFVTFVSFPKSILIRSRSTCIYLKDKFPNIDLNRHKEIFLNKVFRIPSNEIISKKLNKNFNKKSNFQVFFEIFYGDDEEEIKNISKLRLKHSKQMKGSKNFIIEILDRCGDELFKKHFPVPPQIPNKEPSAEVTFTAAAMWIGGRYLKFSRNIGQTPWIINNRLIAEHCLVDILFDSLEKILGCDKKKLTFSASGREDADVRMLGDGRPFYVRIDDPRHRSITFEQFRAIEKEIFKTKLVAVVKLQNVTKNDLIRIKHGEENKRKHYRALCQTDSNNRDSVVKIINDYNHTTLEIQQKTPLRVLHRRTQSVRTKSIYGMEAKIVPGHSDLIEVNMVTQAGTYVKEFVNSDFYRTHPSLCSITKHAIDIVALDVTNVELIWPEEENTPD